IAILSIGNRTWAVPDQNREVREAANEVGIVVEGGITHGETLRFSAFHSADAGCATHEQMRLTVFDSQGNVVLQQTGTTSPNQTAYFDLSADQLPQPSFTKNARAKLLRLQTPPAEHNSARTPARHLMLPAQ